MKESFGGLFDWLIIAMCVFAGSMILVDFMEDLWIFGLLTAVAYPIIQLILGIKTSKTYNGGLCHLGKVMYISAALLILILIVSLFVAFVEVEEDSILYYIIIMVEALVSYWYYLTLKNIQLRPELEDEEEEEDS